MTNTKYLKKMITLSEELERAATAEPYDPDAYNLVITKIQRIIPPWQQRRRRRPWPAIFFCLFLLFCLAWLIWSILF